MSEGKGRWKWWLGRVVGGTLLLLILAVSFGGCRSPWIEPLPGIRVDPTRPVVRASELGPESAYRLLLEAIADPVGEEHPRGDPEIWSMGGWDNASRKLEVHGWPAKLPPPAVEMTRRSSEGPLQWPSSWQDSNPALAPEAPWTLEQYRDLQRLLRLYEARIALLDRALAAPNPQVPTANSVDFGLPYLSGVRSMARWLAVSAQYKAATGDHAGAFQDLDRGVRMGDTVSRGATLVGHLVGMACQAIAARTAHSIAAREDVPAPVLERAARELLACMDDAEPFVEAMRAEAYVAEQTTRWLFRPGMRQRTRHVLSIQKNPRGLLARLAGSNAQATTRNIRAAYQHMVALAEKPYSASTPAAYDRFVQTFIALADHHPLTIRDPIGCILFSMLPPAIDKAHQKAAYRDTTMRATALFLAIQAYEKEQGTLPERLAQLVPDYLPRVPKDPFDGQPLRYLRSNVPGRPAQAWAVYSVGQDFTDDGGRAQGMLLDGARLAIPDLVWPSYPYPKPAEP